MAKKHSFELVEVQVSKIYPRNTTVVFLSKLDLPRIFTLGKGEFLVSYICDGFGYVFSSDKLFVYPVGELSGSDAPDYIG